MLLKTLPLFLYKRNVRILFKKINCSDIYTGYKQNLSTSKSISNCKYTSVLDIPFRDVFEIRSHNVVTKEDVHMFMKIFAEVIRYLEKENPIPELRNWLTKVLRYNCPYGRENPPLTVVIAYKILEKTEKLTTENIKLAYILGLCVDFLHCCFNVTDDSVVIENTIYSILKNYLYDHPSYKYILELFNDTTIKTTLGQQIEIYLTELCKKNIEYATMDKYCIQTKYKSGFIAFNLGVRTAMYLTGITDDEIHKEAQHIILKIGHFYEVENDYLDCFGDVKTLRKSLGGDISKVKCNWTLVKAIEIASDAQKNILQRYIGSQDHRNIEQVISLYKELNIPEIYEKYRSEFFNELENDINNISSELPQSLFFSVQEIMQKQNS